MSVDSTPPLTTYTGNGTSTAFPTLFAFFAAADIVVMVDAVAKVLGVDYGITGGGDANGTITFGVAPASGAAISIQRVTPATQPTSFQTAGSFSAAVHEQAFDRACMVAQEMGALDLNSVLTRLAALEVVPTPPALHYFAIEAIFGSGVTDLTGGLKSHYWKDSNGFVHVQLNAQHTSTTGWTVGTLPVGFRPAGTVMASVVGVVATPGTLVMCQVTSAGVITMSSFVASANCRGEISFRADAAVA